MSTKRRPQIHERMLGKAREYGTRAWGWGRTKARDTGGRAYGSARAKAREAWKGLRIPTRKGALRGWHHDLPPHERRRILVTDVHRDGFAEVVRRLNIEATRERDNSAATTRAAEEDMNWLRRRFRSAKEERA